MAMTYLDKLKKIVEILPLALGFLIFTGFLKLYLFYNHWDIRIIDYLDLSEILLSFLNDLNIFLLIAVIGIIYLLLSIQLVKAADKMSYATAEMPATEAPPVEEPILPSVPEKETVSENLFENFEKNKRGTILLFLAVAIGMALLFFWNYNRFWLFTFSLASFQFVAFFLDFYTKLTDFLVASSALLITFIAFTFLITAYDANEVKQAAKNKKCVIETSRDTIETTYEHYIIGKTQNFMFLYDRNQKKTEILKVEDIRRIKIYDLEKLKCKRK